MHHLCNVILLIIGGMFHISFSMQTPLGELHNNHAQQSTGLKLLKPVKERGEGLFFSYSTVCRRGNEKQHEDALFFDKMKNSPNNSEVYCALALCDGSGGKDASLYASQLIKKLLCQKSFKVDEKFFDQSVKSFSEISLTILNSEDAYQHTTATLVHIAKNRLICSWVGNSRLVVIRDGRIISTTMDHTIANQAELDRIKKNCGHFSPTDSEYLQSLGIHTTRALGGLDLKPYITSHPEELVCDLLPNDLVILASEGLWNTISNDEIINIISSTLGTSIESLNAKYPDKPLARATYEDNRIEKASDNDLLYVGRALCDEAYLRGSKKNITTVVMKINAN